MTAHSGPDLADLAVLPVNVQRLPDGGVRITSPHLPGWACIGRGPHEIARCLDLAWTELAIAAYAATQGQPYDLAHHADRTSLPSVRAVTRQDGRRIWRLSHDPADWTPLPGGDWLSPSGRRYRAGASVLQRVIDARRAAGLPVDPPDVETEAAG